MFGKDAPIINEFPICFECEFIEYQDDEYGAGVIVKEDKKLSSFYCIN